ncbi:MAG: RIP metalloprotease RseP [Candidatus Krumholzibacteriota bacterium]
MSSSLIITIFAFLLTLGLVVIVHELGHFLFCKLFGIYVKTFSIGIGPKFLRKRWGETEYVLSAIPFGGYVKMAGEGVMEEIQDTGTWEERKYPLGTEEGNAEAAGIDDHIPPHRLLHSRPAWQRLLVFIAGPLFNLVLSFLLYTGLVLSNGLQNIPFTTVGEIRADSPAMAADFRAGDEILTVNGRTVENWGEIENALVPVELRKTGEVPPSTVEVRRDGTVVDLELQPLFDGEAGYWTLGLEVWNTTVGLVKRNGPAADLGLQTGDVVQSVNGKPVTSFSGIARIINDNPDEEIEIIWLRDGQVMSGLVVPELKETQPGVMKGRIFMEPFFAYEKVGLGTAMVMGYERTIGTIKITVGVLRDFVLRRLGLDAVGGPLRIGQAAGEMLSWSFSHLMYFVAFFSINLFLLNLMPIPVLDGGHVLFLLVEVARGGKPVPERLQAIATQVGLIILLLFMTFVVVLDVWKVTGH